MGNPGLDPEAALQLFHALLYCVVYIFGGAAIIALSIYIVLLGSEGSRPPEAPFIFYSQRSVGEVRREDHLLLGVRRMGRMFRFLRAYRRRIAISLLLAYAAFVLIHPEDEGWQR